MPADHTVYVKSLSAIPARVVIPPGGSFDTLEAALRYCARLFPDSLHDYVVDHLEGPGGLHMTKAEIEAAVKARGYPGRSL